MMLDATLLHRQTMKIAFVGKGGSGKSTTSWLFTHAMTQSGKHVLAIDADYNMDLAHTLGWNHSIGTPELHTSEADFYAHLGLPEDTLFRDIPYLALPTRFSLTPKDTFTQKYTHALSPRLSVMISGGHNDDMVFSNRCTHAFSAPLKFYLPLLKLEEDELVVVDSVAGTDMVGYGLYTGADVIVVVVEHTPNSIRVYEQIKHIANLLSIPHMVVLNKWQDEALPSVIDPTLVLGKVVLDPALLKQDASAILPENLETMNELLSRVSKFKTDPKDAFERVRSLQESRDARSAS
jgi:CO dehydrogenase maturation factor